MFRPVFLGGVFCLASFAFILTAHGEVITWGFNDHSYELVLADSPTWFEARDAAYARTYNGRQGYLATLTTDDEQRFVIHSFGLVEVDRAWVGGYQDTSDPSYSEVSGGWKWITGEPWITGPDAPGYSFNNHFFDKSEEYLITWWENGGLNDIYYDTTYGNYAPYFARGYLVEYDTVPEPTALVACATLAIFGLIVTRRRKQAV